MEVLQKLQIFHIINAQGSEGDNFFERDKRFTYLRYGISENMYTSPFDTPEQVVAFFEPAHSFLDKALGEGKNVMVHCLAGAHRAGTTGVSYMMKEGRMRYADAVRVAKQQRPAVDPISTLKDSLHKLEWAYEKLGHLNGGTDEAKSDLPPT